jgi:uncharacterized membrane protein YphA (DoxX/SURF4 family)
VDVSMWIVQGLLAGLFGGGGIMKVFMTKTARKVLSWAADMPTSRLRFIGTAEILGAIGIMVPLATGILPVLTPAAAIGFAVIQLLAFFTVHLPRKEIIAIPINGIILAMSLFVAVGRWPMA